MIVLIRGRTNINWQEKINQFKDLIGENGFSVNFLLLLGALTFVIIAVDLDTELSVQKNEIEQVVGVLNESISSVQLDASDYLTLKPQANGTLPEVEIVTIESDHTNFPSDRSPPQI